MRSLNSERFRMINSKPTSSPSASDPHMWSQETNLSFSSAARSERAALPSPLFLLLLSQTDRDRRSITAVSIWRWLLSKDHCGGGGGLRCSTSSKTVSDPPQQLPWKLKAKTADPLCETIFAYDQMSSFQRDSECSIRLISEKNNNKKLFFIKQPVSLFQTFIRIHYLLINFIFMHVLCLFILLYDCFQRPVQTF